MELSIGGSGRGLKPQFRVGQEKLTGVIEIVTGKQSLVPFKTEEIHAQERNEFILIYL